MKHYNPSISEDASRIFNTKQGDFIGDEVFGILANVPITPRIDISRRGGNASSGTISVYTTPSDKDFYLQSCSLSLVKDAACDVATGPISVRIYVDGAQQYALSLSVLTLTAERAEMFISFPIPIKIDRGTAITCPGTFAAGVMGREVVITGYTRETRKGV